jgi:hypothetical protein
MQTELQEIHAMSSRSIFRLTRKKQNNQAQLQTPPRRKTSRSHANKNWTREMDLLAYKTKKQAEGYAWIYRNMASSEKKWGDYINICSGFLGGVVGTSGIAGIIMNNDTPLWIRVLQVVLGFLVSLLSALSNTWRLNETQINDILTFVEYNKIATEITWQLAHPKKDRQEAHDFIRAKMKEMNDALGSSSVINERIKNKYIKNFKDVIFTPDDDNYPATDPESEDDPLELINTMIDASDDSNAKN